MFQLFLARTLAVAAVATAFAACSSSTAPSPAPETAFVSISPAGGASGVSTGTTITMTFSDSMMPGMEAYISAHMGSVSGPPMPMTGHWSSDHHSLTMTPNAPLTPGTTFFIHMGGGMTDANGQSIDYSKCANFGGQAATPGMMGGMMGGMAGEMGGAWMGSDGNYGKMFHFTTA